MIQSRAIVIRVEGKNALVESLETSGCGQCSSEGGCGSSKLSQLFCSEPRRFQVRNDANAQVGALVQVGLPEGMLLQSSILIYLVPLAVMLVGAMMGSHFAAISEERDMYSAMGGFAGLLIGFLLVKVLLASRRLFRVTQPVIVPSEFTK